MKRFMIIATLFCLAAAPTGLYAGTVKIVAANDCVTQHIPGLSEFDGIIVGSGVDMLFTYDTEGKPAVEIEAPSNLLEYIKVRVKDGKLTVELDKDQLIEGQARVKVKVNNDALKSVVHNGSGDVMLNGGVQGVELSVLITGAGSVYADGLDFRKVKLSIMGTGDMKAENVRCDELNASLSGTGNMLLDGNAIKAGYSVKGEGNIYAHALQAVEVNARTAKGGKIECYASQRLSTGSSAAGSVVNSARPEIVGK